MPQPALLSMIQRIRRYRSTNDIKKRIDEIEASGVDEQEKSLELEAAVAKFETILHQSNAEVANMPPLPPRSPIGAALNFGAQKYTSIPVPALAIYACPHNWDRFPANKPDRKAALIADDTACCTAWANAFRRCDGIVMMLQIT